MGIPRNEHEMNIQGLHYWKDGEKGGETMLSRSRNKEAKTEIVKIVNHKNF